MCSDLVVGREIGPDGILVRCKTCYITGNATASLTFDDGGISEIFETIYDRSGKALESLLDQTKERYSTDDDDGMGNRTFDIDIPPLNFTPPAASIEFSFENLELYLDIQTTISEGASITIPLQRSTGPFNDESMDLPDYLALDASFGFELVLTVNSGQVSIQSGVHLKVADALRLSIQLFGNKTSDIGL